MKRTAAPKAQQKKKNTPPKPDAPFKAPAKKKPDRLSNLVFTLNNYTPEDLVWLKSEECLKHFKWLCFGKEVAPETGTPHLQGAGVLKLQKVFNFFKNCKVFSRAHIEPMRKKPEDQEWYLKKEDPDFFEHGNIPQPGKRTDLTRICERVYVEGATMRDLAKDADGRKAILLHSKGLTVLRNLVERPEREPPVIYWLYGTTGTGKTKSAIQACTKIFGRYRYWMSHSGLRWFDRYDGQPGAILDDFRQSHCEFAFLLRLLDRNDFMVEIKGGHVDWVPQLIFVTTPEPIKSSFGDRDRYGRLLQEDLSQLSRRVYSNGGGEYHFPEEQDKLWQAILGLRLPGISQLPDDAGSGSDSTSNTSNNSSSDISMLSVGDSSVLHQPHLSHCLQNSDDRTNLLMELGGELQSENSPSITDSSGRVEGQDICEWSGSDLECSYDESRRILQARGDGVLPSTGQRCQFFRGDGGCLLHCLDCGMQHLCGEGQGGQDPPPQTTLCLQPSEGEDPSGQVPSDNSR